ncbi:hypothetical protein MJO28_003273 [Puccinia striiformis f. sp. tritici]|uniref:CBM1 domain-containing protein n=4 Tax=Puccinia striiformis TaxID=27350 RepID=A0A2S4VBA2_9BASI|nr:hypothetical protein Pst134EB_005885 [Puccinia striiformis f. sp. tritici]KAI7959482.1 hypothetical protein MJO28_003273 [Puccinia striiformis f. sp. tritici]KAI7965243.1 hypothetical protein MJO29_003341 [Puccinia striiformis f. sp. tritici]POW06823.1 hypothetical protein PSTT_08710 [Puccinia striiformis]
MLFPKSTFVELVAIMVYGFQITNASCPGGTYPVCSGMGGNNLQFATSEGCSSYNPYGFCCNAYGSEYVRIALATSNADFLSSRCMRVF